MFNLNGVRVYGFAYAKTIAKLNLDDINNNIIERYGTDGEMIYFSVMENQENDNSYVWLVAANKKLHDFDVFKIVSYLIDNDLIYDYILQSELEQL